MRWAVYIGVVGKKDVKMHIEISRTTESEETTLTTYAKIKRRISNYTEYGVRTGFIWLRTKTDGKLAQKAEMFLSDH
jgi:hypothetical protein